MRGLRGAQSCVLPQTIQSPLKSGLHMVQVGGAKLCVPETMASPGSETAGPGVCAGRSLRRAPEDMLSVVNTGFC